MNTNEQKGAAHSIECALETGNYDRARLLWTELVQKDTEQARVLQASIAERFNVILTN